MALPVGTRLGSYEILGPLGEGGMGEVYRARDTRLERIVALKRLSSRLTADESAKQRFIQEARAASALDHPNICTVYQIDETPDRELFLAMAYYDGGTLADRLRQHLQAPGGAGLPVDFVVDTVSQIARGLAEAHAAGIVHRDIKPANIGFGRGGVPKILDFGLVKLMDRTRVTEAGRTIGTIAYMSPEQVRGEDVDGRTDIWSLGALAYELLTGRPPFAADNAAAVLQGILQREPTPVQDLRPDASPSLIRVVRRALEKQPSRRYARCEELLADLAGSGVVPSRSSPTVGSRPPDAPPSIAVLPFADLSPQKDQDYLCEGIADEIINALTALDDIRVVARTSAFQFRGQAQDLRRIGDTLNVGTVLDGSVRTSGDRLRVTAQLVDVQNGFQLWSQRFDGSLDDVFGVQDEIARGIARQLEVTLSRSDSQPLVAPPTPNLEAYYLYLKGRYQLERRNEQGALELFGQALALDPAFGVAHAAVGQALGHLGIYSIVPPRQVMPQAREAAERALACDDRLPEAYGVLGVLDFAFDWNWESAARYLQRAVELNPRHAEMRSWYALYLIFATDRFDAAVAEARHALKLDPLSLHLIANLANVLVIVGRPLETLALVDQALAREPEAFVLHHYRALALERLDRFEDALASLDRAIALSGRWVWPVFLSGWVLARAGRVDEATAFHDELVTRSKTEYVQPITYAMIRAALGRTDEAFEALEEAWEQRDSVFLLRNWPLCHVFRGDPRYDEMLTRIGLAT